MENSFSKILQRLAAAEVNSTCTQLGPIIQEESLSVRSFALNRTQADAVKRFQAAVQLQNNKTLSMPCQNSNCHKRPYHCWQKQQQHQEQP